MFRWSQSFFRRPTLVSLPPWIYWSPSIIFLSQYFYVPYHITGRCMQPTLNPESSLWRDIGIFDRHSIHTQRSYARDDIVALRSPDNARHRLVKRIVGIEGDSIATLPPYPEATVRIPPGHVWIEGDEPFHGNDSNLLGPVPAALVESKLVFIIWPLNRFGFPPKLHIPADSCGPSSREAKEIFEKNRNRKLRVKTSPAEELMLN